MLIKKMKIHNFRQFKGINEICFDCDDGKNITVIHGENGSGKTTLLQSCVWCLYGMDAVDLTHKHMLVNKSVAKNVRIGGETKVSVEISFVHEGREFIVEREQYFKRNIASKEKLSSSKTIMKVHEKINGEFKKKSEGVAKSEYIIEEIFPVELSTYFLFDGERIKNLGDNTRNGKQDLSNAVAKILGLEGLKKIQKNMRAVSKQFDEELSHDQKVKKEYEKLSNAIDNGEKDLKKANIELNELELSIESFSKNVENATSTLKNYDDIKDLEKNRLKCDNNIKVQKNRVEIIKNDILRRVQKDTLKVFSHRLIDDVTNLLGEFKDHQRLIDGINASAIDQILESKKCLCGHTIELNSDEYNNLVEIKKYIPPNSYSGMILALEERLDSIKNVKYDVDLKELYKNYCDEKDKLYDLANEKEKIDEMIAGSSIDKIRQLENKRKTNERELKLAEDNRAKCLGKIGALKEIVKNNELKKAALNTTNSKNILVQKRIRVCEQIIQELSRYYNDREQEAKKLLQDRVGLIFNDIIRKDYKFTLDDKYNFDVVDKNKITVPMSEGERQITSISFISGLVDMAKDAEMNEKLVKKYGLSSSEIYPVVMDSPFGSLDNEYRKNVSKKILELSNQVIIFVSSSQWEGEVESVFNSKLKNEYILDYQDASNDKYDEYTTIRKVRP